jgi:translation elongation factor EF-1alpha
MMGLHALYSGPTLIEALDQFTPALKLQAENLTKPLRMFVTDVAPVRPSGIASSASGCSDTKLVHHQAGKNLIASVRVVQGVLRAGSKVRRDKGEAPGWKLHPFFLRYGCIGRLSF